MRRGMLHTFTCETLEPRQLLTTVYEPEFVAHAAGGPTQDSAATLLDSGAVAYFTAGFDTGTGGYVAKRTIVQTGGQIQTTALPHFFDPSFGAVESGANIAPNGAMAVAGRFRRSPTDTGFTGIALYAPGAASPSDLVYSDLVAPTVQVLATGVVSLSSTVYRVTISVADADGQVASSSIGTGDLSAVGPTTITGTLVSMSAQPSLKSVVATYDFVIPTPPTIGAVYTLRVRPGEISDLAGNTRQETVLSGFVVYPVGGPLPNTLWTQPAAPPVDPAYTWKLTPIRAMLDSFILTPGGSLVFTSRPSAQVLDSDSVYWLTSSGLTSFKTAVRLASTADTGATMGLNHDGDAILISPGIGQDFRVAVDFNYLTVGNRFLSGATPSTTAISRDGKVIVFASRPKSVQSGLGVYAAMSDGQNWYTQEVLAPPGDGTLDPGEVWVDTNQNRTLDTYEPFGGMTIHEDFSLWGGISAIDVHSELASKSRFTIAMVSNAKLGTVRVHVGPQFNSPGSSGVGRLAPGLPETALFTDLEAEGGSGLYWGAETKDAAKQSGTGVVTRLGSNAVWTMGNPRFLRSNGDMAAGVAKYEQSKLTAWRTAIVHDLGLRPLLVLPGIFGAMPSGSVSQWLLNRGASPESMVMDPIGDTYAKVLATLVLPEIGYTRNGGPNDTLYAAAYDWRMPPVPIHEGAVADFDGPWKRTIDGKISGLTAGQLEDTKYESGVEYLAYWLRRAKNDWEARNPGHVLPSVDIYAHSTGGLVTRGYIQSDLYGTVPLPTVNRFASVAVPHRGASKAWNLLHDNMSADRVYRVFFSKVAQAAYDRVMTLGATITSPIAGDAIDKARVDRFVLNHPEMLSTTDPETRRHEAFIYLYIPTGRALLATYPFIRDANGNYRTINGDAQNPGPQRNAIILDLNSGLDLDSTETHALIRAQQGLPDVGGFSSRVSMAAFYATSGPTLTYAETHVGPRLLEVQGFPIIAAEISPMDAYVDSRAAASNETWWTDSETGPTTRIPQTNGQPPTTTTKPNGDSTVPRQSGGDLFFSHRNIRRYERTASGIDHGSINSDDETLKLVLREFNAPALALSQVTPGTTWVGIADLLCLWFDGSDAYIVDALGRRFGWVPSVGLVQEIPGAVMLADGSGPGFGWLTGEIAAPLRLVVAGRGGSHVAQVTGKLGNTRVGVQSDGTMGAGELRSLRVTDPTPTTDPATQFVTLYGASTSGGLVRGDWIVNELKSRVPNAAFGQGYWGGTNYWFQDGAGDIWSLWHGGFEHESKDFPGQHDWVLTNLTEAAGLSGQLHLQPGSLSGIATGWNAFNIQGIADGKLWALWWSPAGSAGSYIDVDRTEKQGERLGIRGNGWVLSDISAALSPVTPGAARPGWLRPFTASQGNSRTSFDARPSFVTLNNGMSIVVVDSLDRVFVASFNVAQGNVAGARDDLNGVWLVEPLRDLPSIAALGLGSELDAWEADFRSASLR
jgi:hypothetical protein